MATRRKRKVRVYEVTLHDGRSAERRFKSVADAKAWAAARPGRVLGGWQIKEKTTYRGFDPQGRERSFDTKGEAEKWEADTRAAVTVGINPDRAQELLSAVVDRWRDGASADWEAATAEQVESFLRVHILPAFGDRQVGSILHSEVKAWIGRMRKSGLAVTTARKNASLLGRILEVSVRDGALHRNPCDGIEFPKSKKKSGREKRWLERDEVWALADAMPEQYRALVLVGALGGLRFEEITALRRNRILEPVDLNRYWRLQIDEAVVEVNGRLITKDPKSDASKRVFPIPTVLAEELMAHCERFGIGPSDRLFTSPTGAALRRGNFSRRVLKPVSAEVLGESIGTHDLRRTFGALKRKEGVDLKVISRWMGHSSERITSDLYAEVLPSLEADAMARVEEANSEAGSALGLAQTGNENHGEEATAV